MKGENDEVLILAELVGLIAHFKVLINHKIMSARYTLKNH